MSKLTKALTAAAGNAGGDNLYVEDVFSTYLYTGNGTGQAIENGVNLGDANDGGSGYFDGTGDYLSASNGAANNLGTNDFTIECWFKSDTGTMNTHACLIASYSSPISGAWALKAQSGNTGYIEFASYGPSWNDWVTTTNIASDQAWHHCAVTRETNTLRIFVDGVVAGTFDVTGKSFGGGGHPLTVGFMSQDVTSYINGNISNARIVVGTALYTSAFTPPTEPLTAIAGTSLLTLQSPEPFTDNSGSSLAITQVGNVKAQNFGPFTSADAGAGGLVWFKSRTDTGSNVAVDTERGGDYQIYTNSDADQDYLPSRAIGFNANGFSVSADIYNTNKSGQDYASWTFRKAEKFFDVVTYTGNAVAGRTIPHNLGATPAVMIVKVTSGTSLGWAVYHKELGNTRILRLDDNVTGFTNNVYWNSTDPTSEEFTVGNSAYVNGSGNTYVAYLFASDAGGFGDDGSESIIKCGSYTGTGAAGNEVNLGFEPQWLMVKKTDSTGSWVLFDNMRGFPVDASDLYLYADKTNSEGVGYDFGAITATGFIINQTSDSEVNASGGNYIYIAIRRPMKTPESGTEVFMSALASSSGLYTAVAGFPVDMNIYSQRSSANNHFTYDRLRGGGYLTTDTTSAESGNFADWDSMTDFYLGEVSGNYSDYINWMFKRATGFFDVVAYTGDGTVGTINHNLKAAPELIILRARSASSWQAGTNFTATNWRSMFLNLANAGAAQTNYANNDWFSAQPTSTTFSVGSPYNGNGTNYIAYLFATLAGVSKVGSYTGTGSNVDVDCGFSAGARFILIKRTDSTGDWYVWDSVRGIVAGNDPYLLLNSTAAEVTSTDYIDPLSSGFTVTSSAPAALNASGGTYIFLAIA